jgi:hypothetical protein
MMEKRLVVLRMLLDRASSGLTTGGGRSSGILLKWIDGAKPVSDQHAVVHGLGPQHIAPLPRCSSGDHGI